MQMKCELLTLPGSLPNHNKESRALLLLCFLQGFPLRALWPQGSESPKDALDVCTPWLSWPMSRGSSNTFIMYLWFYFFKDRVKGKLMFWLRNKLFLVKLYADSFK